METLPIKSDGPLAIGADGSTDADRDALLVDLWLNGRGEHTARAYRRDVKRFNSFITKPLRLVTLAELQSFAGSLESRGLAPASRYRVLSAIKSLFAFGKRIDYLLFDTARPLRLPGVRDQLAGRILELDDVRAMIAGETNPRDKAILQLLYAGGIRRGELTGLTWGDCQPHRDGGVVTVYGKGNKTRSIRLEPAQWQSLIALRSTATLDDPVFKSRRGGALEDSMILRIVRRAARRAGIEKNVSPHWLRHCHASHALDRGAPASLVQQTLGHASIATTSRYLHARPTESSSRFLPALE